MVTEFFWGTDTGLVRELNEDSVLARPGCFFVADGMGGHDAGEIASGLCIAEFSTARELADPAVVTASSLRLVTARAEASIRAASASAGTTLAGVVLSEGPAGPRWLVAHAGDSRVYEWGAGELIRLTRDHSVVQELIDVGHLDEAGARVHPHRNLVTRALGSGDDTVLEVGLRPAVPGQRLLICSDGLNSELTDQEIAAHLGAGLPTEATVALLIAAALEAGGRDNVSVIVIDVLAE